MMSAAACISASSAGDLIMRQPRTTGFAETTRAPGSCRWSRSRMKQRLVSSEATGGASEDEEWVGLLEADGPRRSATLAEEVGDELQRLLVLVPGPHLGRDVEALGHRQPLEARGDDDRVALRGDDSTSQPLGPPPLDAGEIIEARARF